MEKLVSEKAQIIESHDIELSGRLRVAINQGAKFKLLLSMMEQDALSRPIIAKQSEDNVLNLTESLTNLYPKMSLAGTEQDFYALNVTGQLVQKNSQDALLWLHMHPSPLSLHNDPAKIDEVILANCGTHTQQRFKNSSDKFESNYEQDPTLLHDILQKAESHSYI